MTQEYKVSEWEVKSTYGNRHVRFATQVECPDGEVIRFMDRIPSKREAVRQAQFQQKFHQAKLRNSR